MKNNHKKRAIILLGSFLLIGLLFFISPAQAAGEWWAENVIGGIIRVLIQAIGLMMVLVIKALVWVAQYNDFITSPAVEYSWSIVRDIANMFFVVVLLIIAFATILNQEKYSYKSWLPKVILMAVLINFSKTICGLLIDVAQVVMMTFVNAFKGMAAGNLISNLGIVDVVTMANNRSDIGFWEIVGAYFLGLIYMIVALVVIVTMVAMLVMRMVMIWIYVALSPMAYLFSAFPGGQKYSSMWWSEFSKNLIVGPVLAFFIWLSFVSMSDFKFNNIENVSTTGSAGEMLITVEASKAADDTAVTRAGTLDVFIKFIISIGMLVGGLKIASEIGGAAGKIAGTGMTKLQSGAAWTGKKIGDFGKERVKGVGRTVGHLAGTAAGGVDRMLGAGLDSGVKKIGKKIFNKDVKTNFAGKGVVNTLATGAKNLPGNIYSKTIAKINKNKELDDKRRDYLEQERTIGEDKASLVHNGKSYKRDKNDNRFYEVDEKGAEKLADDGNRSYLKTGEPGKEKDVLAMNLATASFRDSWRSSGTYSRTIANKEEDKKISEEQQKISDSGMTADELRRGLMSKSSSATQKKAYAMSLASQGKFVSGEEVGEAKKYIGNNDLLANKFEDLVDAKQADLNYNLSLDENGKYKNENDVSRFKNRIDAGKINSSKLPADAFKNDNGGLLKALKEFHGAEYKSVIETNSRQSKDHNTYIEEDLIRNRRFDEGGNISVDEDGKLDGNSVLAAKINGNVEKAFTLRDGKVDGAALAQYIKEAKIVDINKIDAGKLSKQLKNAIAEGMNFSKLKSMLKQGDNPKLVSELANHMVANQHSDYKLMKADREIMSILNDESKMKIEQEGAPEKNKQKNKGGQKKQESDDKKNQQGNSSNNQGEFVNRDLKNEQDSSGKDESRKSAESDKKNKTDKGDEDIRWTDWG